MNISRIHHIAIICSDYERSKQFYNEILGFEIIAETNRPERDSYKLDLRLGDRDQIELFSFANPPPRPSRPEARGLRHLAFQVDSVEVAVDYLRAHGIAVEDIRIDPLTNRRFTFFADPDDLPLEIYEE